jgi:hypothetical protein
MTIDVRRIEIANDFSPHPPGGESSKLAGVRLRRSLAFRAFIVSVDLSRLRLCPASRNN